MTDLKENSASIADISALHEELDETSCPICMEYPHNAVLLLCSSHEKGCRSYICDTSYRHSNCLDRFKRVKVNGRMPSSEPSDPALENSDISNIVQNISHVSIPNSMMITDLAETEGGGDLVGSSDRFSNTNETLEQNNITQEHGAVIQAQDIEITGREVSGGYDISESNSLKCPHCRGEVMGWMIVKEARIYLDQKPRSCSRESCSFSGNYRELRSHARRVHPTIRPADVDPSRRRAWRHLEHQREYGDILSAIRSTMSDAVVVGDYVIDSGDRERSSLSDGSGPWWSTFFLFHMISRSAESLVEPRGSSRAWRRRSGYRYLWGENLLGMQHDSDDNMDDDIPIPRRRRRFARSRPDEEQL